MFYLSATIGEEQKSQKILIQHNNVAEIPDVRFYCGEIENILGCPQVDCFN